MQLPCMVECPYLDQPVSRTDGEPIGIVGGAIGCDAGDFATRPEPLGIEFFKATLRLCQTRTSDPIHLHLHLESSGAR